MNRTASSRQFVRFPSGSGKGMRFDVDTHRVAAIASRSSASSAAALKGGTLDVASTNMSVSKGESLKTSRRWCAAPSTKPWSTVPTSARNRRNGDADSRPTQASSAQPGAKKANSSGE